MLARRSVMIRLRPARLPEDVEIALEWYAEPGLLRESEGTDQPYDHATVTRMYEYFAREGELFVIDVRTRRSLLRPWRRRWLPIGDAALCPHTAPIAIGVPEYRSRRVGSQVLGLLVERARELGWATVAVHGVFDFNERSLRMYRSAGFVDDGERIDENGAHRIRLRLDLD